MRYLPIDNQLFVENRARLTHLLRPSSVVVLNANDAMPTNADGTMGFRQNNDLFYLTGVDQEETILVLAPHHPDPTLRQVLFVRETSEQIAIWEGAKLSKTQAQQTSGVEQVRWTSDFEATFKQIIFEVDSVYLNTNEERGAGDVQTRDGRFIEHFRVQFPLHRLERLAPLLRQLRSVKSAPEIDLLQTAINTTEKALRGVLDFVKPGVWEFEIEAEITHAYLKNRSRGHAFQPIVAAGKNACVLHYIENNAQCQSGDLVLIDTGAEYANYNADLTRTFPVSGRFSPRQRQIYDAVLRIQQRAKTMLKVGTLFADYNKEMQPVIESELIGLKLLDKTAVENQNADAPLYRKYLPHGLSHHLGLDVHDVGSRFVPMQAGMVFTCEPGIYVPQEGIGIRLENNVLITQNGNIDLSASVPIEADEIETLMHQTP